jgi:hypothetical protein
MQKQVLYCYNKFFASTSQVNVTGTAKQVHAIKHHLFFSPYRKGLCFDVTVWKQAWFFGSRIFRQRYHPTTIASFVRASFTLYPLREILLQNLV